MMALVSSLYFIGLSLGDCSEQFTPACKMKMTLVKRRLSSKPNIVLFTKAASVSSAQVEMTVPVVFPLSLTHVRKDLY